MKLSKGQKKKLRNKNKKIKLNGVYLDVTTTFDANTAGAAVDSLMAPGTHLSAHPQKIFLVVAPVDGVAELSLSDLSFCSVDMVSLSLPDLKRRNADCEILKIFSRTSSCCFLLFF